MATGPFHYRAAEELLDLASDYRQDGAPTTADRCIAEAQVHATLALAAANGLNDHLDGMPAADALVWAHHVSVNSQDKQPCPRCHCVRNCECDMTIPDLHEDDMAAERDHDDPADDDRDED